MVFGVWSFAQAPLNDLVFTVGTTAQSGANHYSYVLVGAVAPELLQGKRFAVYGKAGAPASANPFTLRATLSQPNDVPTLNSLLNQSVPLGQDLNGLGDSLNALLQRVPGITNQPIAQKVFTALQVAQTNAQTASFLRLYERSNPGLSLARGHAFTELITGLTTYEVREMNLVTGVAGDVIGRVTIAPAGQVVLPAPGAPFQVSSNTPTEDLTIKLRWGTTEALRRLSLLNYGFNVYRIERGLAELLGFHLTPPTTAQLLSLNFVRLNGAPALASKQFNVGGPGGAGDLSDGTTSFVSDNNRRFEAGGLAFNDGQQFYYFVTARDILGRDGLSSPAGLARACKRVPPSVPKEVAVHDAPLVLNQTNIIQRLRITWQQNTNANETVTEYWIYRWPNPSMIFSNNLVPLSNRVGVVSHQLGTNVNSFLDNGSNAPTTPGLGVYWYSVRAVHVAACAPLLSPHSAPASGVLRQRAGPDATTGSVLGSCGAPAVIYTGFSRDTDSNRFPTRLYYRLVCLRRDQGIAWAQFMVTNSFGEVEILSPIYFAPDSDRLDFEYTTSFDRPDRYVTAVACVVGTGPQRASKPANAFFASPPPTPQRWDANFIAGTILLTAVNPADPLLPAINTRFPGTVCFPANNVQADPSGTVTMQFDLFAPRPPVMVQANTNGPNSTNWFNVGLATPDVNGVYAVSYPACTIGPLPLFRGCVADLPVDADCAEHLTGTGAADGAVAPIILKFKLTPRTREFRLYKQVNDGTLSLISQGASAYNVARPNFQITIPDDTMPPSAARLCYYVQLLDEHGNGSPMALLGCKEAGPATPPKPVLSEPVPVGGVGSPKVTLNWFCPTAGVSRFQIMIKRTDNSDDPGFVNPVLAKVKVFEVVLKPLFQLKYLNGLKISDLTGIQYTPKLSSGFGPGPQFTLTADVLPNVPYEITVASVNATGDRFTSSETWPFTWVPPVPRITVPWPFRPLPPVQPFDRFAPGSTLFGSAPRVAAVLFTDEFDGNLDDSRYPVGIRIGQLPQQLDATETIGTTEFVHYYPGQGNALADPALYAFRRLSSDPSRAGESLLPIVVYRQQVTNAAFPRVSGDLVQVTPMIDRIPYYRVDPFEVSIPDRLIAVRHENDGQTYSMYLRDQQPVIRQARYRYFVVRFNDQREVAEVIPAGELEIQYNP